MKLNIWENRVYLLKCFACFSGLVAEGFIDNAKGILLPMIKDEKDISYELYSYLPNAMLLGYMFFSMLAGIIIYKWGYRWAFMIGYIGPIIGFTGIYVFDNLWMILFFLFIASAGLGAIDLCGNSLASITFDKHVEMMFCLLVFFYGVGSFLAPPYIQLFQHLYPNFSYKEHYLLTMIPVVIFFIPSIFIPYNKDPKTNLPYESKPKERLSLSHFEVTDDGRKNSNSITNKDKFNTTSTSNKKPPIEILKNIRVWTLTLILAFYTITERSTSSWGVLYATKYLHVSNNTASNFFTYFLMIYTFSRLINGFITEKLGGVNSLYYLAFGTIICGVFGFTLKNANAALGFIAASGFFVSTFWPSVMGLVIYYFKEDSETASGFVITFQTAIQILAMFGFGVVNDSFGDQYAYILSYAMTIIGLFMTVVLDIMLRIEKKEEEEKKEENLVSSLLMA